MSLQLFDLHNHSTFSDGYHSPEQIIQNAINHGLTAIAITDHFNKTGNATLSKEGLDNYIEFMKKLKEKYKDQISVLIGVEISMNKLIAKDFKFPYLALNKLDLVLFEHVEYVSGIPIESYSIRLEELPQYTQPLNCMVCLAHTDIFKLIGTCFSKEPFERRLESVVNLLSGNKICVELNVNPGYEYTEYLIKNMNTRKVQQLFHMMKDKGVKMTVGSDIHTLQSFSIDRLIRANQIAAMINMK